MTRSELLDRVYQFYPRGLAEGGPGYNETAEYDRQREAVRRGAAEYPRWRALFERLRPRYALCDHSLMLLGGSYDSGYSADVTIPGYRIGFHVSLLGPYYAVHRIGAPDEEAVALDLAREIEAAYPGYKPIPPELGDEVVPDVCPLGRAPTIYACLLSLWWDGSSVPDDGTRSPDYVDPLDDPGLEDETPAAPARTFVHVKIVRR